MTFARKGRIISVAHGDEGDAEACAVKQALLAVGTAQQKAEAGAQRDGHGSRCSLGKRP